MEPLNLKQFVILQVFALAGVLVGVWVVRCLDVKPLKR